MLSASNRINLELYPISDEIRAVFQSFDIFHCLPPQIYLHNTISKLDFGSFHLFKYPMLFGSAVSGSRPVELQ